MSLSPAPAAAAPSAVITITEENLDAVLSGKAPVFLDFWAPWCTPCEQFAPVYAAAARKHPDMVLAQINVEVEQALARDFGIRSVPTLMAIREKVLVYRETGAFGAAELDQVIEQVRLIDMDDLRNELAASAGDLDAIDHCG